MNKLITYIFICLTAVCALVLPGCGGSDSTTSSTKADFVQRAEAICKKGEGEQLQLILSYKKQHPAAEEEELIKPAAIPPLENEIGAIKALDIPEGGEQEVNTWIKEFEATLQQVKRDPSMLVDLRENPFEKANKLAAKYGLETCGGAP